MLKSGLFAVARTKPSKPIKFLADYLSKYEYNASQTSPQKVAYFRPLLFENDLKEGNAKRTSAYVVFKKKNFIFPCSSQLWNLMHYFNMKKPLKNEFN